MSENFFYKASLTYLTSSDTVSQINWSQGSKGCTVDDESSGYF